MSKLAFIFPGQGSQSVGMLADLYAAFPEVSDTFNEAGEVLGKDLWDLISNGPKEQLDQTTNTQPAMLASGVAVWRAWKAKGGADPDVVAGHSLGEYTALVCSGALAFSDAVGLVAERARLMQEAVPQGAGAMAAILGLNDDQVREVCVNAADGDVVEAVNFNAPGQVVIAGSKAAVERATGLAKEAGAKRALPLPVSVPSHCALMKPAAEHLAEQLARARIDPPSIPVIHNASVASTDDPGQIRAMLAMQLYSPVRWVETIQSMVASGVGLAIEGGPGKVLTGLNKRIDKSVKGLAVFDPAGLEKALEESANVE